MAAIAGTKIGTGFVSVEPDWSGFQPAVERDIKARFQKIGDDAGRTLTESVNKRVRRDRGDFGLASPLASIVNRFKKTGDDAGRAFSRGVSRGAAPELSSIAKAMQKAGISLERSAGSSARAMRSLERDTFGVGRAAKRAGVDLLSGRRAFSSIGREARTTGQATHALTGRLRSLGSEMRAARRAASAAGGGFRGFDGGMARVNRSAQFFRNILRLLKWPALIAGVGLFAQGVSALAAGFVAATSALGPLTGALVALPAAALVAAQAFSVLKLATAGVGDAVKAALTAEVKGGAQAVDTMRQQEAAAERLADAKRNLTDVQKQAKIAQEDLTDARESASRELQDMRLAAEGSHDAEQQGNLQLIQARKDLAKTLRDPAASGLDVRFAEEAVDQARRDLEQTRLDAKRAREDYSKARKDGVNGMPEVVAAKRAEEDANRSVADAQRDLANAVRDNSDAMKAQGGAADALQEKMSQLPPAAQKFVRTLVAMKPRLDALRATAASGFFPGAEEGLRGLMGNFGVFRGIVDGTSKALGRIAAKAGRKLGSDVWGKDLGRLGKLNTRIIGRLGDSLLNVGDAFRHVLVAAEPFLDWLSKGTEKFSEWLSTEAKAGRESGALAEFFDRTRETMERVWPILKGVGGALLNIGEAARPLGNEILDSLGSAAEGWRKWTDSTKGQNTLKRYFTESKPAIWEAGKLIAAMGKGFFELGKQRGVAHLLRLIRTELIPALTDVTGAVTGWASDFLKEFGQLRKEGVPTFDAFMRTLADHAGQAGWKIAKALGNAFLHASIWGKLAITGFLLAKFGGLRALAGIGAKAGGAVGKAMVQKMIAWLAGTEAGMSLYVWLSDAVGPGGKLGKVARTSGSRLGKVFGRSLGVGVLAGLVLLAPTIRDAIDRYIKDPLSEALGDVFGDKFKGILSKAQDLIDPANLGPVPTALGIDVKGFVKGKIKSLERLVIPEPKTDKAEGKLRDFSKSVEREGERTRKGFKNQVELLPGIAERSSKGVIRQTVPRLETLADEGGKKGDAFAGRVGGSFASLAGMVKGALTNIEGNVGNSLEGLNVGKAPRFNLKKFIGSLPELKPLDRQTGGPVPYEMAIGGLASVVPGNTTGDRHTLSLNGRPVAKVESKEGIFVGNRNLMGALEHANAAVPRFQKGGRLGKEPLLAGPTGALKELGQGAIKKVYDGAKSYLDKHLPIQGAPYSGPAIGPRGTSTWMGVTVADWIREALEYAARKGVKPQPTSGYRSHAQNVAEGRNYFSEHEKIQYPGGAVDFGGYTTGLAQKMSVVNATRDFKYPLLAPIGFHDDGHASGTGHQRGGLLGLVQRLREGGFVDASDTQKNVALRIAKDLLGFGLNQKGAAGIIGNAWRESLWNPASEGTGGGGLYGFTTSPISLADLKSAASSKGVSWADIGFQDNFMWSGPEPASRLKGALNGQPSAAAAAQFFDAEWERSGVKAMSDRMNGAREAMQLMSDARLAGGPSASGSADRTEPAPKRVPFKFKSGSTGKGGGTTAPAQGTVPTALLHFGPLPKTIKGCTMELKVRRGELAEYKNALKGAKRRKEGAAVSALEANVTRLKQRIRQLIQRKVQLAIGNRGTFPKAEGAIAAAQLSYEQLSERAEQVMSLEPEEGPQAADYIRSQETPAWQSAFGALGGWRNAILGGEEAATRRLARLAEQIDKIKELKDKYPKAWKKHRYKIPLLQKAMTEVRSFFDPGPPPAGSLEESLTEVQGSGKSRDKGPLPTEPAPGVFGGIVWDTQLQLRELGINLKRAMESGSGTTEDDSERASLLEELLRRSNQRTAVSETAFKVFRDFEKSYSIRDLPKFHDGGVTPGSANQEYLALIRGEETMFNRDQTRALGVALKGSDLRDDASAGEVQVIVNGSIVQEAGDTRDAVEVVTGDRRFAQKIRKVIRQDPALRLR